MKKAYLLFLFIQLSIISVVFSQSQNFAPDTILSYKKTDQGDLNLHVFYPEGEKPKKKTPAIIFFFGGGWTGGTPKQFYEQSAYFVSRGIVAISAEYRVKNSHKTTPFECVKDGKSAVRWLRQYGGEIGVDPNKIIASGGSAGGHVAACTGIIDGCEEEGEDLSISSKPNAMVLFNPVLNTTKKGYGWEKMDGKVTEISPNHHIKPGIPPTLNFHGDADTTVPIENAVTFDSLMRAAGNKSKLIIGKGENHGFFNGKFFRPGCDGKYFEELMFRSDVFLKKLGFLKGKPTAHKKVIRVACVGDSNTSRKYPQLLQEILGDRYRVTNNGQGAATIVDGSLFPYMKTDKYKQALSSMPNVVVIMLGTNDANPRWWDNKRKTNFNGSAAEEFSAGLDKLITSFKSLPTNPVIMLCTPIPVFAEKNKDESGRKKNLEEKVTPLILDAAKGHKLKIIDLYKVLEKRDDLTIEGVHYNDEGYRLMSEKIKSELIKIK